MDFKEKIATLQEELDKKLLPIISKKCIYLDLPYHLNIGDTLIWDGTDEFIKKNNISCLYTCASETYKYNQINSDTTVLLHGGGNYGDLWIQHQNFRLRIVEEYPNNEIVILPQTVYYHDIEKAKTDAKIMSKHKNLTICARDQRSYSFLKEYFTENNIILVPDMAFYISDKKLNNYRVKATKETLFLKRTDKELKKIEYNALDIPQNSETRDWPSMEKSNLRASIFYKLTNINSKLGGRASCIVDFYFQNILKDHLIRTGVEFVSSYNQVYTTRLHVAILRTLLHEPFIFLDNSYGKNKGFYDTWLSDLTPIRFISDND